jgi:hypothetical protein
LKEKFKSVLFNSPNPDPKVVKAMSAAELPLTSDEQAVDDSNSQLLHENVVSQYSLQEYERALTKQQKLACSSCFLALGAKYLSYFSSCGDLICSGCQDKIP